jgi:hypothetical protein
LARYMNSLTIAIYPSISSWKFLFDDPDKMENRVDK